MNQEKKFFGKNHVRKTFLHENISIAKIESISNNALIIVKASPKRQEQEKLSFLCQRIFYTYSAHAIRYMKDGNYNRVFIGLISVGCKANKISVFS